MGIRVARKAILIVVAALPISVSAQIAPAPDQPQLAARGPYAVGVRRIRVIQPDQPDFFRIGIAGIPKADRVLDIEIWYPITRTPGMVEQVTYTAPTTSNQVIPLDKVPPIATYVGQAVRDADPVRGKRFPLVVASHGFTNWAVGFSYLGENLASKGYVVASIEHRDPDPYIGKGTSLAIGQVISRRTADQRFVIAELARMATLADAPLHDVYDPTNLALIGYSMGGFGALTTAGAGYSKDSLLYKSPVGKLTDRYTEGGVDENAATLPGLKALVLLAPWGAQPPYRAWSAAALANITVPSMIIDGDQDDVTDFQNGIKYLHDHMTRSDRYLLVYENARHNIAINETPHELARYFPYIEHWNEPVWRSDRIYAINSHFITAFLDERLKGDKAHGAFLNVPTLKSNDGTWPVGPQVNTGPIIAADQPEAKGFWPGFQRRWAVGLELYHKPKE